MAMDAIVFGASGGIGSALTRRLTARADVSNVHAVSRQIIQPTTKVIPHQLDMFDESDLSETAKIIGKNGKPHLIIVATGILSDGESLQPEKSYRHQSLSSFERVFRVNTFGPALIAKHFLPIMPRQDRTVFAALSARVGSISDNRSGGWHAYRASKSALNMLVRNYAIEQKFRNKQSIIVGLHPGTVDTALSKPFQKRLPDGQVISADQSAESLLKVIDSLEPGDSGKMFDWKGLEVLP